MTEPETDLNDLHLGVILASIREGRRGETYARWIHELIAQREGVRADLIDLRDHDLPPYRYPEMPRAIETRYTGETARRWSEIIHALDGYVMVTPEYNRGYPGQLKNALDHVQQGWWYKPAAFVSYGGGAGGARAVDQLRNVAVDLRMVPVRTEVNIRLIGLQADEAGRPTDPYYARQSAALIDQLLWWARVAKQGRTASPPPAS